MSQTNQARNQDRRQDRIEDISEMWFNPQHFYVFWSPAKLIWISVNKSHIFLHY